VLLFLGGLPVGKPVLLSVGNPLKLGKPVGGPEGAALVVPLNGLKPVGDGPKEDAVTGGNCRDLVCLPPPAL
jgi:hypothetical protein